MNEATLIRLKIDVERAVRPVVASTAWKLKTREELLAHVTAVFEEEMDRLGDETLALARTEERFGSPAELTEQLQASVPANDRFTDFFERALDGTVLHSWRHTLCYAAGAAIMPAILCLAYALKGQMAEWPIAAGLFVLSFSWIVVIGGMRDALFGPRGRSWPRAVLFGLASWLTIPIFVLTVCWILTGDWRSSFADGARLLPLGVMTPPALVCWAFAFTVNARAQKEWTSLQLG
jgi:hypothetical protein